MADPFAHVLSQFDTTYDNCPARWFDTVGAAMEYAECLRGHAVSFRMLIVKGKGARHKTKGKPYKVVILFMGGFTLRSQTQQHVIPLDDLREHYVNATCWCRPEYDDDSGWVHNALDQRERYESGELELH